MFVGRGGDLARFHPGGAAPRGPALSAAPRALLAAARAQAPAEKARLAAHALLLDGAAAGERLVVVGERGHALFSDDGENWTQAEAPARAMLAAVHMHDARTGWAVGHDAIVLRTADGGENWRLLHYAPDWDVPLLDVHFADARAGFAVGAFGLYLATEDGGETWTCRNGCADGEGETPPLLRGAAGGDPSVDYADDFHLNAIAADGPRRLYLAGEAGALYRSDDAGATWRALESPYGGSWFAALSPEPGALLVAGLRGRLFRSGDAGETWTRIAAGGEATLTGAAAIRDLVVAVGLAGAVLVSADGGRTFRSRALPSRAALSAALPAPGGGILLLGEAGITPLGVDAAP